MEDGPVTGRMSPDQASEAHRIANLIAQKRIIEATAASQAFVAACPSAPEAWLVRARALQSSGDLSQMKTAVEKAYALRPDRKIGFMLVEASLMCGDSGRALAVLHEIERDASGEYATLRRLTDMYTQCSAFDGAARAARAAADLAPNDADALFNLAPPAIALGRLADAESALDQTLALRPNDWDAHYLRATIRKQTPQKNHVADLKAALDRGRGDPKAETALGFALSKELEDLDQLDEAFDYLEAGAAARRRRMSYAVEIDEGAMASIATAFGEDYFSRPMQGYADEAPIFIVGMPRSGTTLVDRILSQHSQVASRGELNDLPLAITRATPTANDKTSRIAAAADADPRAIGESYARSLRGWGDGPARLIDKAPLNFLYVGVIAKALPNARIIHLRRHPMASGYAMFKTYFRMGYPFSYDQSEIGRYLAAYTRLMRHWGGLASNRVLDVAYEDIVDDVEGQARRLLDHCNLDWEPACAAFHENTSPSATASAAQVRRPIYRDSLDQWRRIEHRLRPLASVLEASDIDIT